MAVVLLLATAVRLPFWVEGWRTPVDGDTAIVGLMARHPFASATLWGQPYGSPVDAWLAAPFLGLLRGREEALRLPAFLLSLGLVATAYALGAALHPRAGLPAALLLCCPPAYLLLMASLPPPLYAATLLLSGLVLVLSARLGGRLESGPPPVAGLVAWGTLSGLAVWTHLMAAAPVGAAGVHLVRRAKGRGRSLWPALAALLVSSAPVTLGLIADWRWGTRIVALESRQEGFSEHLANVLPVLHRPVLGLLGGHVPTLPDDPTHVLFAPGWTVALLAALYALGLAAAAVRSRLVGVAGMLAGAIALTVLAFPFPLRSSEHTIRYLSAAYVPLAALVAWAPLGRDGPKGRGVSWCLVLTLAALHLLSSVRLLATWRVTDRRDPPFLLLDLSPTRRFLAERRISHAFASYEVAYRLTFLTGERIVVSQPWNERFRHYPLPYLDEVRFSKNLAWLLQSPPAGDLPTPRSFEDALNAHGGAFEKATVGALTVFHAFAPPYGPDVDLLGGGAAGDGDLETRLVPDPSGPVVLRVSAPRPLAALTLVAGLGDPPLPRGMDVEVSADGISFETVARRRRREERSDLRWANGQPQCVLDDRMVAVPLHGRIVAALRITPRPPGEPWALGEVLLHPEMPAFERRPWDEWLDPDLGWAERRRALAEDPRRDREDWYFRTLVAESRR
jgi:hypothetical protein